MSGRLRGRWLALALTIAVPGLAACVAADGDGYYDGGGAYYSGGYYEPFVYGYGGWGHDYHVGPGRGGVQNFRSCLRTAGRGIVKKTALQTRGRAQKKIVLTTAPSARRL